ncbi:hypothetical protein [uncultured Campylobacter sp.]|uniref:hypothetical protein n=1 Tax=uncultured Campylobacter sp. TaxID=218934 RepID=UPI0026333E15|nr:hypothetical protein [uncultured Campylobacter sp.]
MNASEFAKREGKKLYVIDVQASKDRKIGRTDRFRKLDGALQVETEHYYLAFKDPITPALKERIERLYYEAIELVASDYELAWIAHKGTGSPHLNVLQRFLRFRWHRGGKIVEKMCENLEALLAMNAEARAEFLAREREAMREAAGSKKEEKDEI